MLSNAISRRCFVHVGGYDPKTADAYFARLEKEFARHDKTWRVRTSLGSPQEIAPGVMRARAACEGHSKAGAFAIETDIVFLSLEPVVQRDFADPAWKRAWRYALAFANYWTSGTAFGFFRHAWRFSGYFLYPAAMLLAILAICALLAWAVLAAIGWAAWWTIVALGAALALAALPYLGARGFILHLADLWSFSNAWLRGDRPDANELFARYGEAVAKAIRDEAYDEVVMLGHSTGGAIIAQVAFDALRADPDLRSRAQHMSLCTVGSTALKIGLHPRAGWFRDNIQALHDAGLDWFEFQEVIDIVNFPGTDPTALMGVARTNPDFGYATRVRFKKALPKATYRRVRKSVFRTHYQFVFAGTVPYWFDYVGIACGPLTLRDRVRGREDVVAFMEAA